jgi:diguanylate cyclase (GGDEF)-like protein
VAHSFPPEKVRAVTRVSGVTEHPVPRAHTPWCSDVDGLPHPLLPIPWGPPPSWRILMENVPAGVDKHWLSLLTEALPGAVWSTDRELTLTAVRGVPAGSDLVGLRLEFALGLELDHPAVLAHHRALAGDSAVCDVPWPSRTVRAHLEPVRDASGAVIGVAGAGLPVVEAERAEPAVLDRSAFLAALEPRLKGADARGAALVLIDIDGFGALSGRLGHAAGDLVLDVVGRRLAAHVRAGDLLGKTGGDEFAVLVHGIDRDAHRVVNRLREALAEPMDVAGATVQVRTSAGVVRLGPDHRPQEALLEAETAMARAKADGRDRCVTSTVRDARSASLERVEAELRRALGRDELRKHFEPMVAVKSGRVDGFEVLLWRKTGRTTSRPVPIVDSIPPA